MTDVLVAGSLHWDVIVDAPRLPALDETVMGRAVSYRLGGKGANQAVAAAQLGAKVQMAGRVGQDAYGKNLLAALDRAGVQREQVIEAAGASGMSVAIVEESGEYGAVVVSGVNRDIRADDIHVPPDLSVLLLQNEIPEAVNVALARRVGATTRVVLNAAPARTMSDTFLSRVDVLVANRVEAADITGLDPSGSPDRAAGALRDTGPGAAILTLGADGLVIADATGSTHSSAIPVEVISAHGAGDVFCGALAAEIARGIPLPQAARFGAAAAALAVSTQPDARGAIAREDVMRLLKA